MATDSNSGTVITLREAIDFTHAFQENNPNETKSYFVGINKLNLILEQEGCIGVRIYNGYDESENKNNLVLIGVDENEEDITNGIIVEHLITCPPFCPKSNDDLIKP